MVDLNTLKRLKAEFPFSQLDDYLAFHSGEIITELEELRRDNARLMEALEAETYCQTCDGTGVMHGDCECGNPDLGWHEKDCACCHGTGEWSDECAECEGVKRSFRSDKARAIFLASMPTPEVQP